MTPRSSARSSAADAFPGETITRRRLVTTGAHVAGTVAVAAAVVPALVFAVGPVTRRQPVTWQPVGSPVGLPDTDFVPRIIGTAPDLGSLGRLTIFVRRRNPRLDTEPADRFNRFIALTSHCSHVGCPVRFYAAAGAFVCPCHGGVYDRRGIRTGGPPPRPLDRFLTRVRRGQLEIGPRYSVDSRLRRYDPRDPGEPLDGIGRYLYPRPLTTPRLADR